MLDEQEPENDEPDEKSSGFRRPSSTTQEASECRDTYRSITNHQPLKQ